MKEFKGTKGKWNLVKNSSYFDIETDYKLLNTKLCVSCSLFDIDDLGNISSVSLSEESEANAKLISSSPEMFEELKETIIDLKILKNQIIDANKTNHLFNGMPELMEKWIERKEQLLTKITE